MIESKITTRDQMMEHIFKTIGLSDETSTNVVEYLGIKRADIIEGMIKDNLLKMKGESGSLLKVGDYKLLEKFKMCYICYIQMKQGKLPT